jgi:hypothetical protein
LGHKPSHQKKKSLNHTLKKKKNYSTIIHYKAILSHGLTHIDPGLPSSLRPVTEGSRLLHSRLGGAHLGSGHQAHGIGQLSSATDATAWGVKGVILLCYCCDLLLF